MSSIKKHLTHLETVGLIKLVQAQSDIAKARDYFSRAVMIFDEIKAAPDAARTRAALESLK